MRRYFSTITLNHRPIKMEKDGCGVGLNVSLQNIRSHYILQQSLKALVKMEHRGGVGTDGIIGDGSGIMTGIPFELFNREPETFAVASLLLPRDPVKKDISLKVFEQTFADFGLEVAGYRDIPVDQSVLSPHALAIMPDLKQAIVLRPEHCRTLYSFERLLYMARQMTRTKEKDHNIYQEFYFNSLSPRTIVYKALCKSMDLARFYLDLQNPNYKTNFAICHRRFSTNTISTWDKIQPFRFIAHNGEINTIEGNRAWAITREKAMGLRKDELITHEGISDSGNLNGMAEALRYRSGIPKLAEAMAILMPPAQATSRFYTFWSRGMEPWDGPAMVAFSDGKTIGARLDRNGFRPCRWQKTADSFYLSSETGVFDVESHMILEKGALSSGESVTINAFTGQISFLDPKDTPENKNALFDPQLIPIGHINTPEQNENYEDIVFQQKLFRFSKEEIDKVLIPMVIDIKEPISSMGDTACLAFLSKNQRSIFDFFYQDFAQVTNPPLDYIREKIVTDMRVFLGRKPNIIEPKEFIPPKPSFELAGPVISLGQMDYLYSLTSNDENPDLRSYIVDITIERTSTLEHFSKKLEEVNQIGVEALKQGYSLLILTDRAVDKNRMAIPSLLILTSLNLGLNQSGRRMRTSIILDVGDARNAHHLACLLGHGATAVCPRIALKTAIHAQDTQLLHLFPLEREKRLIKALSEGILRIMAKMGISVFRSYQGSKLFTPVGLGPDVIKKFFPNKTSIIGGYSMEKLFEMIKQPLPELSEDIHSQFIYKEHPSKIIGESHTLTTKRSRFIHKMLEADDQSVAYEQFKEFSKDLDETPLLIRHLLQPKKAATAIRRDAVEPVEKILERFGSGAMSFGAISAEAQRDLILAFKETGGRSNSGEGGENPYYDLEGITSSIKQIASGRFGVTAEYLVSGDEVQIKIAQGAKPGEGGQLMGAKVTEDIAKARFTSPGIDLISPPPQHDIYSIEDLKELIYELKQLRPNMKVSVKLVSGTNIGAISVGVAKAGADIIQISGGDGGTGAASLLSMKHAGLPLEIGLSEVHRALTQQGMRKNIILRADGGFLTGKDLIIATLLGAEQFDFGKLLLVGEGCIMARVCEKNTCPTGIATHNPKFKAQYKGEVKKVVRLLHCLAQEVQDILATMAVSSLESIVGQNHLLTENEKHLGFIQEQGVNLSAFFGEVHGPKEMARPAYDHTSDLNAEIVANLEKKTSYSISNTDRAIPTLLSGLYAMKETEKKTKKINSASHTTLPEKITLSFTGSAGQGFAVFNVNNVDVRLSGEANDSVAKGMSGGKVVINPFEKQHATFESEKNTIIGNCALYGATGGMLFIHGKAGDRFAVRNSGAHAVVESVGFHACEYMSGGKIWILNETKLNIGAGMSGGVLYILKSQLPKINSDYIVQAPILSADLQDLTSFGEAYLKETNSRTMKSILDKNLILKDYIKLVPKNLLIAKKQ